MKTITITDDTVRRLMRAMTADCHGSPYAASDLYDLAECILDEWLERYEDLYCCSDADEEREAREDASPPDRPCNLDYSNGQNTQNLQW